MCALSGSRTALTTSPQGMASSIRTAVRSFRTADSSAPCDGAAASRANGKSRIAARACRDTGFLLRSGERIEFDWIGEDAPERLARARDGSGQGRIAVLDDGEHLQHQQVERLPQRGDAA